ncbi:hypothetical protein D6C80_05536 [Aureobasidium pullulans]|nr:hypothetical protein D6C80_05536 [Aureobasidium pullulans]
MWIAALEQLKDEVRPHRSDISDESLLGTLQIEDLAESDHSKDSFEDHHSSSGQDSADSEASSEYGELKESLISDYSICLERLEAMQTTIEGALRKLNTLSTKRSIVKPKLIREVDKNGRQTLLCLKAHIIKSVSHRRIMRKGNPKSTRRSAETTKNQDDDDFVDALAYQYEVREYESLPGDRSTKDQSARQRWELEQQRWDVAPAEAHRRYDEEVASIEQQIELECHKEDASAAEAKRNPEEEEANSLKLKLELETEREAMKRKQAEEDEAAEHQNVANAQAARDAEVRFKLKLDWQAREEQEREERAYEEFLHHQREKEAEEERAYREALRKQKETQEAEDQAKKEEQARIDSVMRARLEKLGYSQLEIELALDPEKAEKEKKKKKKHRYSGDGDIIIVPPSLPDATPMMSVGFQCGGHVPLYPRINRQHLDLETLEHYHVPWEYDRVRHPHTHLELCGLIRQQTEPEFVILLRELDKYETDVLFEHTRRRRLDPGRPLIIEKADKAPNYAWVRRKSKDPSHGLRSTLSNAVVEEAKHKKVGTHILIPTEKKCTKQSTKDAVETNTKGFSNNFISREDDKDVEDLVREWTNLYQDDSSAPESAPDEQASSRALRFGSRTYSRPVVYYHSESSLSSTVGAPVTGPRHAPKYVEVVPSSSRSSSSSASG